MELVVPGGVMVGGNFLFTAIFSNNSRDTRMLTNVVLNVFPIDYRGERLGWDKVASSKPESVELQPGESECGLQLACS